MVGQGRGWAGGLWYPVVLPIRLWAASGVGVWATWPTCPMEVCCLVVGFLPHDGRQQMRPERCCAWRCDRKSRQSGRGE